MTKERDKPIEPQFAALLDTAGFVAKFWELTARAESQKEAYEITERIYESAFGKRKYASFESFIQCRNNYLKSLKKNATN